MTYSDELELKFDNNIEKLLEGKRATKEEIQEQISYIKRTYGDIPIIRVCCFGRVSSKHEEQESSLYTQRTIFHQFVDSKRSEGYVIVEEIYDRLSGTNPIKRKKFINMVKKAKHGEYDLLLFKSATRYARNMEDFTLTLKELNRNKVIVEFINESIKSNEGKDFLINIHGSVATEFSDSLHRNVKKTMKINMEREEGRMTHNTFGYDKPTVRDSRIAYINEKEAEYIRELFTRLSKYEGLSSICDDWRARGIKTKKGSEMSTLALKRYARNKKYIGILEMGKDTKPDLQSERIKLPESEWIIRYRPDLRIVSDELFYKVQTILDNNKPEEVRAKMSHPFIENRMWSGIIKCSCCGGSLIRNSGGNSARPYKYFSCMTNKQRKRVAREVNCNNHKSIREDELQACMSLYFTELLESQEDIEKLIQKRINSIIKEMKSNNDKEDISEIELEEAREKFKRAKELYMECEISKSEFEEYRERLKRLEDIHKANNFCGLEDFDVKQACEKLFNNLGEFVTQGMNEETIDGYRFNSLFESIISDEEGKLTINFRLDDSYLVDINSGGCILNNESQNVVNINDFIDWGMINRAVNEIRNKDTYNRRMYRLSKRFKHLGKDWFDEINIVI